MSINIYIIIIIFLYSRNNNNNNNNLYRGLVGISNIGNTCFMASSLQCLSNIYSLTLYFLRRQYMNHINTKVYYLYIYLYI